MQAGFNALRPGVSGWEVDAAARSVITQAGYAEPEFALGHRLGQTAHDGGCLLGPRWGRYGTRPEMKVDAGNVFTLEYALPSPAGPIGLEEDVLVTSTGAEYLSRPQTELVCLRR
jgi:Xaa-Pro aminopeptidase